jgi:vacuolar-type H+-ATPase catalytic subunit A/Vma1
MRKGEIERITGSVITVSGIEDISVGEVVEVGEEGLIGETIRIDESGKLFTVQVYETTSGIRPRCRIRPWAFEQRIRWNAKTSRRDNKIRRGFDR